MSTKSILTKFVLIAAVLTIAAFSPDKTVHALKTPARIASHFDQAIGTQMSLHKWRGIQKDAIEGDLEAIYQLGRAYRWNYMSHLTGFETDKEEGNRLVRKAASLGHPWALINVWEKDGEDPDQLLDLSRNFRHHEFDSAIYGTMTGWLQWYAVQGCNIDLLTEAKLFSNEQAEFYNGITGEGISAQQDQVESKFNQLCLGPGE